MDTVMIVLLGWAALLLILACALIIFVIVGLCGQRKVNPKVKEPENVRVEVGEQE